MIWVWRAGGPRTTDSRAVRRGHKGSKRDVGRGVHVCVGGPSVGVGAMLAFPQIGWDPEYEQALPSSENLSVTTGG